MTRQSISFTEPNSKWLHQKVAVEGEYRSNSDAANDAIRKMREAESETAYIRARLIASEKSGFIDKDRDEILAGFKDRLRANGEL